MWGDPLLVIMVPFVVAIAYLTGWLLLWIALKVSRGWIHPAYVKYRACLLVNITVKSLHKKLESRRKFAFGPKELALLAYNALHDTFFVQPHVGYCH